MKRCAPRPDRSGFTLVEVLVSSAVLAIVLAVMFAALSTSLSLWRNTDNKIIADREARAVELMLVRDVANAVVPPATSLWPQVTNIGGVQYLRMLTVMPPEAQALSNQVGDVCYVEYAVLPSTNASGKELRRFLLPSSQTYAEILSAGTFPEVQSPDQFQSLGLNLLPSNNMAARGTPLGAEANPTNFVLLGGDMLPFTGAASAINYPVAIEVNFAIADPDTLRNTNLINSPDFRLRNAGLYSFRVPLPKPVSSP